MWGHWNTLPIKADAGFNMDHFYFVNVLSAVGLANAMVNHTKRRTRIFHVCCIVSFHETYYKMHVGIRCRSRFSQCSPISLKIWRISIYVTGKSPSSFLALPKRAILRSSGICMLYIAWPSRLKYAIKKWLFKLNLVLHTNICKHQCFQLFHHIMLSCPMTDLLPTVTMETYATRSRK